MENQYKYTVCIHCMTYNHKPYILDALHGFAMQQTKFPYVALVMDDASTDGEPEVLRQYIAEQCNTSSMTTKDDELYELVEINAKDNPNCHFAFYFLKQNLYGTGKKKPIIDEWDAKVKYIAMCEGDDYWTDPYKLQKQVDFMEGHKDYSVCFHSVKILNQALGKIVDDFITRDVQGMSTIEDLSNGNYIHTPSVMYRYDSSITDIISQMGNLGVGDYISHMLHACNGKIMKLPDVMAVYRYGVGVWSSTKQRNESKDMQWMVAISKLLPFVENPIAKRNLDEQISLCIKSISDEFVYLEGIRNSHAYRLGKAILRPFSWIKRKILAH